MKTRIFALLAVGLFAAPLVRAESYDFKEAFSRTGVFDAAGKVSLHNINGNITVETWDKNEIRIEGEKSAKTEEELKLIQLTIDLSASSAAIDVKLPKRTGAMFGNSATRGAVSFKLMIPATASLEGIKAVNSSVTIEGVRGKTRVETVNGQIHAQKLGGNVQLETVNGEVEAKFATVAAHQVLTFKTVNGSVKVALPTDSGVELRSSVINGNVECDFPLQGNGHAEGKHLSGTIGDGRATLHAESVNGGIHIGRS